MKRIIALVSAILLVLTLCAGLISCEGNENEQSGGGVGFEEID